jgi:hypothetical protein
MTQAVTEALTIAEAAERTGVSTHTLRYYERIGALREPPERAPAATAATPSATWSGSSC